MDGDTVPEILIEGCQTVYIVKAAGNDSFYVWETLPGHIDGSSVRVFDLDANGYAEVIVSGNNETRIYEYEPGGIEQHGRREMQQAKFTISPNPFREELIITYKLPEVSSEQEIELTIYDISGRLVRRFIESTSSLCAQICWDGCDTFGHGLPNGVYFLKLQAGDYSATEKVLLIR